MKICHNLKSTHLTTVNKKWIWVYFVILIKFLFFLIPKLIYEISLPDYSDIYLLFKIQEAKASHF